jgi:hypothetical protein
MKRLVYSPEVNVWVKSDTGIFDLSPYVTGFSVTRKVNSASQAEVTFRNPKVEDGEGNPRFLFTQHPTKETNGSTSYRPMFHPMDPIVITLTRLKGHPVQVFTGYCDTTPYVQLFPGTTSLTATCTIKRLKYTYWDPGLPFVIEYLSKLGWGGENGTIININAEASQGGINDSSIGYLLYKILEDVGGWDSNDIYIQDLPSEQIVSAVSSIYEDLTGDAKASYQKFQDFLKNVIGSGKVGDANQGSNNDVGVDIANLPKGLASFDGTPIAGWIKPILDYAKTQGWSGSVTSGYRSTAQQARLYERYKNSGFNNQYLAAKPGQSNHEGHEFPKGAVDVSEPETLNRILMGSKYKNTLCWAITHGLSDHPHFSHTGH